MFIPSFVWEHLISFWPPCIFMRWTLRSSCILSSEYLKRPRADLRVLCSFKEYVCQHHNSYNCASDRFTPLWSQSPWPWDILNPLAQFVSVEYICSLCRGMTAESLIVVICFLPLFVSVVYGYPPSPPMLVWVSFAFLLVQDLTVGLAHEGNSKSAMYQLIIGNKGNLQVDLEKRQVGPTLTDKVKQLPRCTFIPRRSCRAIFISRLAAFGTARPNRKHDLCRASK